ncbi:MAG: RNase adapter RapZ [Lachnospiraceae bacterium]|nr:RNase adapter RapZ [Lachnospiraceae bacterium]
MRFVIVTGMSGGGKRTCMRLLEDAGYYCVDNLPVPLIDKFFELLMTPNGEITKVALGIDVRADQNFADTEKALNNLKKNNVEYEIVFMEASDKTLIKRYKETRRIHPLAGDGSVEDGIKKEREILKKIKKKANYIFDTSNLLVRDLNEEINKIFVHNEEYNSLMIRIVSFGFKYGIPADADLVFDVRFLPNPFYIEELKPKTGNDKPVHDYVMSFDEASVFLDKLDDMVEFLIPNYVKEGKHQLVIGIGCTGGKHRSVTLANELYNRLKDKKEKYGLSVTHRDEALK